MKRCPFCAEEIQDAAIVCRYCQRDLPVSTTPTTQNQPAEPEQSDAEPTGAKQPIPSGWASMQRGSDVGCPRCAKSMRVGDTACRHCGVVFDYTNTAAERPVTGGAMQALGIVIGLSVVLFGGIWLFGPEEQARNRDARVGALESGGATVLDAETEATVEPDDPGLRWQYSEGSEQMGRGVVKHAIVRSLNELEFGFPYQGSQRGTLVLRQHPKHGKDVILTIERGQFLCRLDECTVAVRFDDRKPRSFSAAGPADHRTTSLFIRNYGRFVAGARKAEKAYIEAPFYQEGSRVFEFDVSGLQW